MYKYVYVYILYVYIYILNLIHMYFGWNISFLVCKLVLLTNNGC